MDIKKNLQTKALANEWKNLKEFDEHYKVPKYVFSTIKGVHAMAHRLQVAGGNAQQQRMIKDKRRSLDRALWFSYQGAFVKKYISDETEVMDCVKDEPPIRALINPNKLKPDYDEKIISIGFEHDFHTGDIFEWCNTNTRWLIYLQDLTELAYFRGEIRRCSYEIEWLDEDGNKKSTLAAIRGPVETKIDYIQKHGISVDNPNYSLHILMPLTEDNKKQFKRYSKFYLQDDDICWRVEATDWISTPGILELNAVEYYANETEDDVENGLVGAFIAKPIDPNPTSNKQITGDTFIKVKQKAVYVYKGHDSGHWYIKDKVPVKITSEINSEGYNQATIVWEGSYNGQFDLYFGIDGDDIEDAVKTIVVESLF